MIRRADKASKVVRCIVLFVEVLGVFFRSPPRAFKTGSKARDELEENAKRHRNWDVKIPPQVLLKMKKTPTVS